MPTEPKPSDFGLTQETLFDANVAMNFWREYDARLFLKVMVNEIKSEVSRLELVEKQLRKNPQVSQNKDNLIWLENLSNSKRKLLAIANICMYYAKIEDNDSQDK